MPRLKKICSSAAAAAACVTLLPAPGGARQHGDRGTVVVTGQVVDKDNRPVDGVEVQARMGSERVARDRTKNGGRYTLKFKPGDLVSVILYTEMDYCPCSIFNVSGRTPNNITKVIYRRSPNVDCRVYEDVRATLAYIQADPDSFTEERRIYAALLGEGGPSGAGTRRQHQLAGNQSATDRQLDALLRRIETRSDTFRASLDNALDRARYDGTRAEDDINRSVLDFEQATDLLRARFNSRSSVAADAENVLRQANLIDGFMRRNRLSRRAQSDWSLLRNDLNELASTYNVAWNWDANVPPGGTFNAGGLLNGTYRLDPTRSDSPREAAERATANVPLNERQRIYERMLARLESPDVLAIERRGSRVTIASTRAPQTTFSADGRERMEQLPNGTMTRVSATLNGDRLVVRSTGYRENDFTVTFDPVEGGRALRVTREIWSQRLGEKPVVVQNTYTRTSEVADLNIYNPHSGGGTYTAGRSTTGASGSGEFVVANGTTLIATLDRDLSTQTTKGGDPFTMTVRSPAQFEGATIEGHVSGVDRSGSVTGRSQITFNFDRIRLRDGRTYNFAGWVESVRTPAGETVSVDTEGKVRDDSQTNRTVQRTAIGTAVGAIIGAIAGGGKGAAIGAVLGAGAGAGSVYVQGRDDLELQPGTELTVRASAPHR